MKKFIYAFALVFLPLVPLNAMAQEGATNQTHAVSKSGGIKGKVLDKEKQPVPFASIGVFQDGILKGNTKTDINGKYNIKSLQAGIYTIKIIALRFKEMEVRHITIKAGEMFTQNIKLEKKYTKLHMVGLIVSPPIIDKENPNQQKIDGNTIRDMFGG